MHVLSLTVSLSPSSSLCPQVCTSVLLRSAVFGPSVHAPPCSRHAEVPLETVLDELGRRGIMQVMVEGGVHAACCIRVVIFGGGMYLC